MVKEKSMPGDKPLAFVYRNRYHEVSGWKYLVHDLIEDIIFNGLNADCKEILDINMPSAGVPACVSMRNGSAGRLSNGYFMPLDYGEETYALLCRDLCLVYSLTPVELRIFYREDIDEIISGFGRTLDKSSLAENPESKPAPAAEHREIQSLTTAFDSILSTHKMSAAFYQADNDAWKEKLESEINTVLQEKEKQGNLEELLSGFSWDDVIDCFENCRKDIASVSVAKRLQKSGIVPPSDFAYELVTGDAAADTGSLAAAYVGRIIASAAMIWEGEKVAYLTEKQNFCAPFFRQAGYRVFINDAKALSGALTGI